MAKKSTTKESDFEIFALGFSKGQNAGRAEEREKWLDSVPKGMVSITIRVRDDDDETENIRIYIPKSEVVFSEREMIPYMVENTLRKIHLDGKIIKKWLKKAH